MNDASKRKRAGRAPEGPPDGAHDPAAEPAKSALPTNLAVAPPAATSATHPLGKKGVARVAGALDVAGRETRPGALWAQIHAALLADLAKGRYGPGDRLPSESRLACRFGVNRHTVRRALAALVADGAIHIRRGAGATVTGAPIAYRIGSRTRFGDNLRDNGRAPAHRALRAETLRADADTARLLGLAAGARVHVTETVGLADAVPVSHSTRLFPARRFPRLLQDIARTGSVSAALAAGGLSDYTRAWTRMAAEAADPAIATHLWLAPGAPLLAARALSVDADGMPVEYGETRFAGGRVEVTVGDDSAPLQRATQRPETP
ncbi:MAG: phosphonate metabolism transcriptional regulator PhnF [Pseudomonadota bacterium]